MDGWGIGQVPEADAIRQADTPYVDGLLSKWPNSRLTTFGEDVGLPEGQMGNSEVGHLNIGAGRVVFQELLRINRAVADGSLRTHPVVRNCFATCQRGSGRLHVLGLVSDGGVHSHWRHIAAVANYAAAAGIRDVYVHAFLDGRDTDPRGGRGFLADLAGDFHEKNIQIASVIGRYYAMDRDKRWERTKRAYHLLVRGEGQRPEALDAWIEKRYAEGTTDEFMEPALLVEDGVIRPGDSVFFVNFRTDRPRQLTEVLTQRDHPEHGMEKLDLHFTTMTRYDASFADLQVVYGQDDLAGTLGEWVSRQGLTQLRAAETEKYPHVTFFFSGGREKTFEGEDRILVPSPKVATYDLQPEMSAVELTERLIESLRSSEPDFVCLNYANADMVGHTGVFEAAMRAAETVDRCLSELVEESLRLGYRLLLIADHGNSDYMVNEDGSPNTAHTKNPVPCILVGAGMEKRQLRDGILADVAPTILAMMELSVPDEMTGKSLF